MCSRGHVQCVQSEDWCNLYNVRTCTLCILQELYNLVHYVLYYYIHLQYSTKICTTFTVHEFVRTYIVILHVLMYNIVPNMVIGECLCSCRHHTIVVSNSTFHKTLGQNMGFDSVTDDNSIVFTVDLHLDIPPNMVEYIRKVQVVVVVVMFVFTCYFK